MLGRKSYASLVHACLQQGEVRRAHQWSEAMINAGFVKPNKDVMRKLIRDLTDVGNLQSARKWIAFMADHHQAMDSQTYAYVRDAHPQEILPCKLSGETKVLGPSGTRPVRLSGEDELEDGVQLRPMRPASLVLPPRSPRPQAMAARWPARLVTEVRLEASKKMSPALKAEFFRACSGQDVVPIDNAVISARRIPRRHIMNGVGHYVQRSYSARAPKLSVEDWNPYWREPPAVANHLYGGP